MLKIFKYSFYDMVRNRWMFVYTLFFLIISFGLLLLSGDLTKVIISLTNISLILTPMIGILFGTMYYYNSREFIRLLLGQPISRGDIFKGMYAGLGASLSVSVIVGMCIPLILFGVLGSEILPSFLILCAMSVVLSLVFSMIGFLIGINYENKIQGFGIAIFSWLFFAVIYDGIFLLLLLFFRDYPLEKVTLGLTMFNPIDLARILILLKLDISAMMGYTGAVLQKFLGSSLGSLLIVAVLLLWLTIPFYLIVRKAKRKDF